MLIPIGDIAPRQKTPFVNYGLLGLNVFVFLLTGFQAEEDLQKIVNDHGLIPKTWSVVDVFTSMFLHANFLHLFGNMLFLWIAGDNVEDRFGHVSYLAFYLAVGVAAAAAQVLMTTTAGSTLPMIGASGAVSGVLGAYLILFPFSRVKMLLWLFVIVHVFTVPSWTVILLWIAAEALQAYRETQGEMTPVAVWAHLGGFAAGFVMALFRRLLSPFRPKPRK